MIVVFIILRRMGVGNFFKNYTVGGWFVWWVNKGG